MQKNKVTTYLLYSIGEIVLVVIGIMIAVSINNWNQEKKDRIQEKSFLKLLIRDLEADSLSLNTNLEVSNNIVYSKRILLEYKKGDPMEDSLSIHFQRGILTAFMQFVANQGAIEDIKNAGGISLIKSETLRSQILELYNSYEIFDKNVSHYHLNSTLRIRELAYQKASGALFNNIDNVNLDILERLALDNDIRNRVINNWAVTYNRDLKLLATINSETLNYCRKYLLTFPN